MLLRMLRRMNLDRRAWLALMAGILLMLPAFWVGLQLDDYFHWALVTDANPLLASHKSAASPYGLFSFMDGDPQRMMALANLGLVPWWTYPELSYAFWRPVAELTHAVDYAWLTPWPPLMHAHSLVYFALMLWIGFHLFRQLQPTTNAWLWAAFFWALAYTNGVPVAWLANRNALLATLFLVLTLLAHHQWRLSGSAIFAGLAWICFVLGLLSGELAVGIGGYVLAYALAYDQGDWRERLASVLPYVLIGGVWLAIRISLDYGAEGSGHYLDPMAEPALFVQALYARGIDLMGGLLWGVPPELGTVLPEWRHGVFLLLTLGLVWLAWPLIKMDRVARFWLLGALFCLPPVASTLPHSRLLIAASLGIAGFLGVLVVSWRGISQNNRARRWGFRVIVPLLIIIHLPLSAMLLPLEAWSMKLAGDQMVNKGALNWQLDDLSGDETVILLNPPLSSAGGYINGVRTYFQRPVPEQTWLLASGIEPLTLTTVDRYTFELYSKHGLYQSLQESVLRGSAQALAKGDQVQLDGMTATILAVSAGVPTQVSFRFKYPLANAQRYRFYHWQNGKIGECVLPPPQQSLTIALTTEQCYEQ